MERSSPHPPTTISQELVTCRVGARTPDTVAAAFKEALLQAAAEGYFGAVSMTARHEAGVVQFAELERRTPKRPAS